MRTAILTAVAFAFTASQAWAIGGHGNGNGGGYKTGTLRVVNDSQLDLEVSINSSAFEALEPGGVIERLIIVSNKSEATVAARLLAAPGIGDTKTASLAANKTTVATISATSSAVSIAVAKPANIARVMREAGVALASSGGLLPLLWLGMLLGRRPPARNGQSRD
jgi:hypothetical protein